MFPTVLLFIVMAKITRSRVREFLLQSLYARSQYGSEFNLHLFAESFYIAPMESVFWDEYFSDLFAWIPANEGSLLAIVKKYAPKFDPEIMPLINLLPIFIAAYEMLYLKSENVPPIVSINEAVELAKKFSDDSARELVNGVLNKLKDDSETVLATLEPVSPLFFK
jgi:transcription antitermination protein NusB